MRQGQRKQGREDRFGSSGLIQPCLAEAEIRGSQGFEALNAGVRERGKGSDPGNAGESCQACGREGPWAGAPVSPSQKSGLAALMGLSSHGLGAL